MHYSAVVTPRTFYVYCFHTVRRTARRIHNNIIILTFPYRIVITSYHRTSVLSSNVLFCVSTRQSVLVLCSRQPNILNVSVAMSVTDDYVTKYVNLLNTMSDDENALVSLKVSILWVHKFSSMSGKRFIMNIYITHITLIQYAL